MMQQSLRQFDSPLHSAGESFYQFFGTIEEPDSRKNFLDTLFQRRAPQAIKMSLMPEIFVGRELQVDALCLEDDADLPPQACRFLHGIAAHNNSAAGGRNH